jgi:hypothetical protein
MSLGRFAFFQPAAIVIMLKARGRPAGKLPVGG